MQQVMHQDEEEVMQAEAVKLSKISNSTVAIVRMDKVFEEMMKGLISYAGAIELQYGVKFMQACIKHIVVDMMPPNYLLSAHGRLTGSM